MKLLIVLAIISICHGSKSIKRKRGIFNEDLFLGGIHDIGSEVDFSQLSLQHLDASHFTYDFGYPTSAIDLGSTIHKHITVTNNIGVPLPQPYAVPIEKKILVSVPHAVPVPIDRPYPVQIPKPFAVPIDKPYPVTIEKPVPYPVNIPVKVRVNVPVAVAVPKPIAVPLHKLVPYVVSEPVKVYKAIPAVKTPAVSIGSGSLGYTHLGNGAYAIGSGSLGVSGHRINERLVNVQKLW